VVLRVTYYTDLHREDTELHGGLFYWFHNYSVILSDSSVVLRVTYYTELHREDTENHGGLFFYLHESYHFKADVKSFDGDDFP